MYIKGKRSRSVRPPNQKPSGHFPMYTTKKSLLKRMQNCDEVSWEEFHRIYWPLVHSIGQTLSLPEEDCQDLMQEVMVALFHGEALLRYDKKQGKFRTYLGSIVRHKTMEMLRASARLSDASDDDPAEFDAWIRASAPSTAKETDPFRKIFDEEYAKYLLALALDELRKRVAAETYDIFELVVLQKHPVKEVAKHLGIDQAIVSVYASRCRSRLRKIVSEIRADNPEFNPVLPL